MSKLIRNLTICFLVIGSVLSPLSLSAFAQESADILPEQTAPSFEGKTISILGDSICTYQNASSGVAADTTNSTIRNNRDYYKEGKSEITLNDTWWMQAAQRLGARILVNNSYSGSRLFYTNGENEPSGFYKRPYNLHDNTGENSGEEPDIIVVYMGTNDITHNKKYLGSYDEINYGTLIREINNEYVYKTPATSAEAYAVMLHKIANTYKNSEIYCFTILPRVSNKLSNASLISDFNESIIKIAEHQDCNVVDLYNDSGIKQNDQVIKRYLSDAYLHPNKKGMDAIEAAFISALYKNSKYSSGKTYNVSYDLENTIVNEGTYTAVCENTDFRCSLSQLKYGEYNALITMDGKDISAEAFSGKTISIPVVTGDVDISVDIKAVNREFKSYRFEKNDNGLTNIFKNENYSNNLSKENTYYSTESTINLYYDTPWSVVFRTAQNPASTDILFDENGNTLSLDTSNNTLGFKVNDTTYGLSLSEHKIDLTKPHTYKITNAYNTETGINTFDVYVDTSFVGSIDSCFKNSILASKDISPLFETDFKFSKLTGSESIEYIQIWENKNMPSHIHSYGYPTYENATCAAPGTTTSVCDCGAVKKETDIPQLSHTEGNWIISKPATAEEAGEAYKKCSVCKQTTQTKSIPQLKCKKPAISSLSNTEDGIKVTWNKVTGADCYRVYRHVKNGKWTYLCTTTETSFIDTNIKNGYWYYYTVRAVNEAGYSDYYKTGNVIQALYSPTVKTPKILGNGIKLSWSKVKGAQGYYIYKKTGDGKWKYYCRTTKLTYTDKNVKKGIQYSYRVRAYRNDTLSGYSYDGASATYISAPVLKKAYNTTTGTKIQWGMVSGAKGYYVYRKTSGSGWKYIGKTTSTSFTDTKVSSGKIYIYTVKAFNNEKQHSTYNTTGIKIKRLSTPGGLDCNRSSNGLKVSWQAVAGANGYNVYRKTSGSGWKYIGKTTSLNYTDKTAVSGTTYTYTVRAYSGSYTSTYNAKGTTAKR